MIKIDVKAPTVDVEIEKKIFKLDLSDKGYQKFYADFGNIAEEMKNLSSTGDANQQLYKCKESCKKGINSILLNDPFDEIYLLCGESTVRAVQIFYVLVKTMSEATA